MLQIDHSSFNGQNHTTHEYGHYGVVHNAKVASSPGPARGLGTRLMQKVIASVYECAKESL